MLRRELFAAKRQADFDDLRYPVPDLGSTRPHFSTAFMSRLPEADHLFFTAVALVVIVVGLPRQ